MQRLERSKNEVWERSGFGSASNSRSFKTSGEGSSSSASPIHIDCWVKHSRMSSPFMTVSNSYQIWWWRVWNGIGLLLSIVTVLHIGYARKWKRWKDFIWKLITGTFWNFQILQKRGQFPHFIILSQLWSSGFKKLQSFQRETWKSFSGLHRFTFFLKLLLVFLNRMNFFKCFIT